MCLADRSDGKVTQFYAHKCHNKLKKLEIT